MNVDRLRELEQEIEDRRKAHEESEALHVSRVFELRKHIDELERLVFDLKKRLRPMQDLRDALAEAGCICHIGVGDYGESDEDYGLFHHSKTCQAVRKAFRALEES